MEITVEGKDAGVYGRCAAKVIFKQSGEVYPEEKGESYCSNSKTFVIFHFNFAYASDCSMSNMEQ